MGMLNIAWTWWLGSQMKLALPGEATTAGGIFTSYISRANDFTENDGLTTGDTIVSKEWLAYSGRWPSTGIFYDGSNGGNMGDLTSIRTVGGMWGWRHWNDALFVCSQNRSANCLNLWGWWIIMFYPDQWLVSRPKFDAIEKHLCQYVGKDSNKNPVQLTFK